MRFAGKAVIVTGAGRGIGLACARRFASEGAYVIVAERDEQSGSQAAAMIVSDGGLAQFVHTDVADARSAGAVVDATLEWAGRVDVLINNAGIVRTGNILDMTEADFDDVIGVNLKGAFLVGQAAANVMAQRGGGAIVNMSSINAQVAIADQLAYVVSKGGLNQLTRAMALGLADRNIRVNAIGPGSIRTEMLDQVMNDDSARYRILSRTPLMRPGEPDEIAALAAFLASDEASYITGEIIYADGGRLALNYTVSVPD
ncbi:MAG: SDR family oxidoreductase [Geminicoccaceae bacterium]|nr:SDR family oxidoreductase [Geminicoccaceae bacterium]MCB9943098.1 SDR family oxidoreductase [Geminicoccaceae bacterium]